MATLEALSSWFVHSQSLSEFAHRDSMRDPPARPAAPPAARLALAVASGVVWRRFGYALRPSAPRPRPQWQQFNH